MLLRMCCLKLALPNAVHVLQILRGRTAVPKMSSLPILVGLAYDGESGPVACTQVPKYTELVFMPCQYFQKVASSKASHGSKTWGNGMQTEKLNTCMLGIPGACAASLADTQYR